MPKLTTAEREAEKERVNAFLSAFNDGLFSVGTILTPDHVSMLIVAAMRLERQRTATVKAGSQTSKKKTRAAKRNIKTRWAE